MDWLQFFASIFHSTVSLAWPAALALCVWLFHDKLVELLPFFNVKHKDWEMSFRLRQAESEAAKLAVQSSAAEAQPTPEEKSKFEEIARLSPRAAMLEMRANLEEAVRDFADAVGVSNTKPYLSYAGLVRVLRQHELIDANTSGLLDDLRAIGNSAAHNQHNPSEVEALRYGTLAEKLVAQLNISAGAARMPPPGPLPQGTE